MGETFQKRISALLLSNRRHARYVAMVMCMAVAVVFGVAMSLTQKGQAKTHEETVLDCQYSGDGAHTHVAECYDADGNLVCPLEEKEYHVHDDSCYASETYLVCGLEEGAGAHTHDESCYDEEGNLVCELEESEGHVHTDECWQTDTYLVCDKDEVTEEHVHGEGCFKTIVVDDGEEEPAEQPADVTTGDQPADDQPTDDQPADEPEAKPAETKAEVDEDGEQTFTGILKDTNDQVILTVNVKAPAGALPKGTTMKIAGIPAQDFEELERKVDEAVKKSEGEDVQVKQWQAVDITFLDKDGNEIEPSKDVEVKITSDKVNEIEQPLLVHVVDWAKESAQGKTDDAEVVSKVAVVNADENDKTVGNEDTLKFQTDEFSPYVIVETIIDNGEGELVYEGEDYTLKITYTAESKIPAGTLLTVSEIEKGTPEYYKCLDSAWKLLNKDYLEQQKKLAELEAAGDVDENVLEQLGGEIEVKQISDARYFDINLTLDGEKIEPEVPVTVEVTYNKGIDVSDEGTPQVIHFAEDEATAELKPEEITDATVQLENGKIQSVVHQQDSFSPTGYQVVEEANDSEVVLDDGAGYEVVSLPALMAKNDVNLDDIEITGGKTVTPNNDDDGDGEGDGTYTLALDVIGQAITVEEPTKANVVIVLDFSGSMFGTEGKYVYKEVTAPYPSGTLYGYTGSGTIISGACYTSGTFVTLTRSSSSPTGFTYNGEPYYGKVYTREISWYSERAALRKMISTLMAYNEKWEGEDDVVEISLVGFGLYGKLLQDWTNSETDCLAAVNGITNHLETYTNWEAGYRCAQDRVNNIPEGREDAPTYVLFLTDGNPNRHCNGEGWGKSVAATCNADSGVTYARDEAYALAHRDNCTVYNVFSYGPASQMKYLRRLNNYAQTGTQSDSTEQDNLTFFDASHDESLYNALSAIASEISEGLTFGGVQVIDGVTTGVTSTTVTGGGDVKNFRYAVKTEFGSTVYTVEQTDGGVMFTANGSTQAGTLKTLELDYDGDGTVDETKEYYEATFGGATYKMCLADVDANGLITWDLGGVGTLQPGWTYELSCIMWPEQDCYDLLADLNNGDTTIAWNDSIAHDGPDGSDYRIGGFAEYPYIVKYSNGTYGVLTNTDQNIKYRIVETDTEGNVTYGPVKELPLDPQEPMPLDVSETQITKEWDDSLDPQQLIDVVNEVGADNYSVTLNVYKDTKTSEPFKSFVFKPTWDDAQEKYVWNTEDISLPCGLMVSEAMAAESGLLGTTRCSDSNKVVISGVTYYVLETGHDYWIEEEETDYHFEFSGDHIRPMEVDGELKYVELDDDGNMIGIKDPSSFSGTNSLKGGINIEKVVNLPEDVDEVVGLDVDEWLKSQAFEITVTLKDGDGNPISTDEGANQGFGWRIKYGDYNPLGSKTTPGGSAPWQDRQPITNGEFTVTVYAGDMIRVTNVPSGTHYTVTEVGEEDGILGIYDVEYTFNPESQTVLLNTAHEATVTNTPTFDKLAVIKVDGENPGTAQRPGTTLANAKFDLYGDDYYTTSEAVNPDAEPLLEGLVSDANGKIEVGYLVFGTYYLVETEAPSSSFNLLESPIKVVYDRGDDGTPQFAYYQDENAIDSDGDGTGIYVDTTSEDCDVVTIVVTNSKGAVLPKTGGPGTTLFTITGSAMCLAAVVMYGFTSRRRREGRLD